MPAAELTQQPSVTGARHQRDVERLAERHERRVVGSDRQPACVQSVKPMTLPGVDGVVVRSHGP
jgi:hypothetical protein